MRSTLHLDLTVRHHCRADQIEMGLQRPNVGELVAVAAVADLCGGEGVG